jgi:hypothetical protein
MKNMGNNSGVIVLFSIMLTLGLSLPVHALSTENVLKVRDLYAEFTNAHNHVEITNVLVKAQKEEWVVQEYIVGHCLTNCSARNKLIFDEAVVQGKHDLSLLGGRCAWIASNLLNTEVPPINAETSKETITKAEKLVSNASYKRQRLEFLSAIERAKVEMPKKPLKERQGLAGIASTKPSILAALAEDSDVSVRRSVAANARTPFDSLDKLVLDVDAEVREVALDNKMHARTFIDERE